MTARVELKLEGAMDHLRLVWQTGETMLELVPFTDDPEGTRYNVLVALQEMVTNVYRHAYGGDETGELTICYEASDAGIALTLTDGGPPFDPCQVSMPELNDDLAPRQDGGYGIMIARAVMDDLDYVRSGDQNVVMMRKRVQQGAVVGSHHVR